MNAFTVIIVGIFVLAVLAMRVTHAFGLEKWQVSIGLLVLAAILYFSNIFLIRHFIRGRTRELVNDELWDSTAGFGIVPKWVSVIGLLSFSALITAVLPWIIVLFKAVLP